MNYQNSVLFASAFCFGFANICSNSSNNCFFSGWSKKNTFSLHKIAEKVMSDLKVKGNYVKPQSEKTPAESKQNGMRISQNLLNCASTIHFIDLWSYKNILHSRKVCLSNFVIFNCTCMHIVYRRRRMQFPGVLYLENKTNKL